MADSDLKNKFEQLHQLLIDERECAKALDIEGLQHVVGRKAALLAELKPQAEEVVGFEDLLKKIDHENRRNAYLLLTGLAWVRETMRPDDEAMVAAYGTRAGLKTLAAFTGDKTALLAAIDEAFNDVEHM